MEIKSGDLVMVVKPSPCCGNCAAIGRIFTVKAVEVEHGRCGHCKTMSILARVTTEDNQYIQLIRLKKIDPPTEGDSLPTRKDLEVPV